MALFADGELLTVDGRHIERDTLESLSPFANMPEMMHFDLVRAIADGTVIAQLGLCASEPPLRLNINRVETARRFLDASYGLIKEVDFPPIRRSPAARSVE